MNKITLTVGTVTYALKLKKLFSRANINSRLVKVDNTEGAKGCSHGVEISWEDYYSAVVIMKENGIKYSVYENRSNLS